MLRRTAHPWLRPVDFAANAAGTWRGRHMPPDQLLRETFETCATFGEARTWLGNGADRAAGDLYLGGLRAGRVA